MEVRILGAIDLLYFKYKAVVSVSIWAPDALLYIVGPKNRHNPDDLKFGLPNDITILTSPKNEVFAKNLANAPNEIINSPLAKVMSEEDI